MKLIKKETISFFIVLSIALNTLTPRGILTAEQYDFALDLIKGQSTLISTLLLSDIPLKIVSSLMGSRATLPASCPSKSNTANEENTSSEYFITGNREHRELSSKQQGKTPFTPVHVTAFSSVCHSGDSIPCVPGGTIFLLLITALFIVLLARSAIEDHSNPILRSIHDHPAPVTVGFFYFQVNQ